MLSSTLDPSPSSERGARVRFPPPLVFLIGILAGLGVQHWVKGAAVPIDRTVAIVIGVLIVAGGLALIAVARTQLVRTGQNPAPWKPSPELVVQGPYKFTRNPMYVGMTCVEVGLGVAVNNAWISVLAFPALAAVHFIAVLPEERYLSEKFGESYTRYLAQSRRYL